MSRSIGDTVARSIGVIPEPEIRSRVLSSTDKFLILGSDGLFNFLPNSEVVSVAAQHLNDANPDKCCDSLLQLALNRWKRYQNSVDDITIIVIFFNN